MQDSADENDGSLANVGLVGTGDPNDPNISMSSNGILTASMHAIVRTSERSKKPKKIYDPSAGTYMEQQNAARKVKQRVISYDTCNTCHRSEIRRGSGYKRPFLSCNTCKQQWHYACVFTQFESATAARSKYKCKRCRKCCVCFEPQKRKLMVVCAGCAQSYHLECHYPELRLSEDCDPKWKCQQCDPHYKKQKSQRNGGSKKQHLTATINGKQSRPTVNMQSPASTSSPGLFGINPRERNSFSESEPAEQRLQSNDKTMAQQPIANADYMKPCCSTASKPLQTTNIAESRFWRDGLNVPDWSVDEVVQYVSSFFPEEAHVFHLNEIDGKALLLLTRHHVLTRLGLTLETGLLLYELVSCLQNKTNDLTLVCDN